jgi:hypothetical protein
MTHTATLQLGGFAQTSLDRLMKGIGRRSPNAAVRTAVIYYLADKGAERTSWRVRQFRREPESSGGVDVAFDDETWDVLEAEAEEQGVTPEVLAVHALLYLLADLDSGRIGDRLDQELG